MEEKRLDIFVSERENISRSASVKLIEEGHVTVNGKPAGKSLKVTDADDVVVTYPPLKKSEIEPEDIPLDIVYEDGDLLVVNKPKGMVVHPAPGHASGTLVNALLYHCGSNLSGIGRDEEDDEVSLSVGGFERPGIVHRIDKDTSGLIVVAKNDDAHIALSAQLKERKMGRIYEAIAVGLFKEDSLDVDAPIGRHPTDRKKMAVIRGGREAVSHFSVINRYMAGAERFTHIKAALETGRTHQIRVHLASISKPCLGDPLYGGDKTVFARRYDEVLAGQCLHARTIEFIHPSNRKLMRFESPLPDYFNSILDKLTIIS